MLRELQVTMNKPANAMAKSNHDEKMKTGTAVLMSANGDSFAPPEEDENRRDLFFVDKERIPTGMNVIRTDVSDYDEDFTTIAPGEFAKLIAYHAGERFATDQFVEEGLEPGVNVGANSEGKLIAFDGRTKYVFKGFMNDAGHKLAIIQVVDC